MDTIDFLVRIIPSIEKTLYDTLQEHYLLDKSSYSLSKVLLEKLNDYIELESSVSPTAIRGIVTFWIENTNPSPAIDSIINKGYRHAQYPLYDSFFILLNHNQIKIKLKGITVVNNEEMNRQELAKQIEEAQESQIPVLMATDTSEYHEPEVQVQAKTKLDLGGTYIASSAKRVLDNLLRALNENKGEEETKTSLIEYRNKIYNEIFVEILHRAADLQEKDETGDIIQELEGILESIYVIQAIKDSSSSN
jgi:hypothetical protein